MAQEAKEKKYYSSLNEIRNSDNIEKLEATRKYYIEEEKRLIGEARKIEDKKKRQSLYSDRRASASRLWLEARERAKIVRKAEKRGVTPETVRQESRRAAAITRRNKKMSERAEAQASLDASRSRNYERKFLEGQQNKEYLQRVRSGLVSSRQTSTQPGRVLAGGRGGRINQDTPTRVIAPGVELGRSERTGRSFIIREGGTGQNARILAAAQRGADLSKPSSSENFYMAVTPTSTRRAAGFQYQPSERASGVQPVDQPSPVNFPYYQRAIRSDGSLDVDVPVEQRAGFFGDFARFQRRLGDKLVPYSATRAENIVSPVQLQENLASNIGGREARDFSDASPQFREFGASFNREIRERPITTFGSYALGGYGLARGTGLLAARSALAGRALRAGTLGAGVFYGGSVAAAATFSGEPGRVLGSEAPRALSFGVGYGLGSGSGALLAARGARSAPVDAPITPSASRSSSFNFFNRRRLGRNQLAAEDPVTGEVVFFNVRRGGRGSTEAILRQRGVTPPREPTFFEALLRSRRGQTRTNILEPPRPRTMRPKSRSRPRSTQQPSRFRIAGAVPRTFTTPRPIVGNRFGSSTINRIRPGVGFFRPSASTFNKTGSSLTADTGFRPAFRFDLSSWAIGAGAALGLGLGLTRGGGRGGGFGLGAGGGGFGRGFGSGRAARPRKSQYTASFAAIELNIIGRGRAPRGSRRFTGAELRPVFGVDL